MSTYNIAPVQFVVGSYLSACFKASLIPTEKQLGCIVGCVDGDRNDALWSHRGLCGDDLWRRCGAALDWRSLGTGGTGDFVWRSMESFGGFKRF